MHKSGPTKEAWGSVKNWWSGGSKPYQRQEPVNVQSKSGQSEAKYSVTETWDNKKATTTITTGNSASVEGVGAKGTFRGSGYEKTERVESSYAGGLITTSTERSHFQGRVEGGLGYQDGELRAGGSIASIGAGSSTGLQLNLFGFTLNILEVKAEYTFGSITGEGKVSFSKEKGVQPSVGLALGAGGKLEASVLGIPYKQLPPPTTPDKKDDKK